MLKFKVGDTVRVRDDIKIGKNAVVSGMMPRAGGIATIVKIACDCYVLNDDPLEFYWSESSLEAVNYVNITEITKKIKKIRQQLDELELLLSSVKNT